jgi:hypothetical protein
MNLSFYRFFFKSHGATVAAEVFRCDGDSPAVEKAKQLLSASAFNTMEVWHGSRKVSTIERSSR